MIGGEIGRPASNSSGPGDADADPEERARRRRASARGTRRRAPRRGRGRAPGPPRRRPAPAAWARIAPARSATATSMLVAPTSATSRWPTSARKRSCRGARPPVETAPRRPRRPGRTRRAPRGAGATSARLRPVASRAAARVHEPWRRTKSSTSTRPGGMRSRTGVAVTSDVRRNQHLSATATQSFVCTRCKRSTRLARATPDTMSAGSAPTSRAPRSSKSERTRRRLVAPQSTKEEWNEVRVVEPAHGRAGSSESRPSRWWLRPSHSWQTAPRSRRVARTCSGCRIRSSATAGARR